MAEYYDLSIPASASSIEIKHLLTRLQKESIGTVALDFQFQGSIQAPTADQLRLIELAKQSIPKSCSLYTRSTLTIEQSPNLHQLSQPQPHYDIMAVKPTNEKMFHAVCTEYDRIQLQNYDIICFQMGVKMPFMLKRNPVYEAIRKGKFFEIQYEKLFDEGARVVCMTNILNIFKATKGKNIVISSHSGSIYTHRTPYDVASLMISLGMEKNLVLGCMNENCKNAVKSAIHRSFFKGSIKVIEPQKIQKISKKIKKHRQAFRKLNKGRKAIDEQPIQEKGPLI